MSLYCVTSSQKEEFNGNYKQQYIYLQYVLNTKSSKQVNNHAGFAIFLKFEIFIDNVKRYGVIGAHYSDFSLVLYKVSSLEFRFV